MFDTCAEVSSYSFSNAFRSTFAGVFGDSEGNLNDKFEFNSVDDFIKFVKKGFIKYEKNKKGKNVVKYLNKPEHMKLWFKESFGYEPTTADLKKAGFDYSEALRQSLGQISWEAVPHSSTNHLKGLETGEPKIKSEYHTDISKAFLDDKGRDIIAQRLGLLSPGEFEAPGYYMGIVNPGSQTEVVMPKGYKTGKTQKIEKSTEDLIEAYAIARGILMKQEMVGWHRPFYNTTIKESNGLDLNLGRQFNLDEIGDLSKEIQKVVDKEVKLMPDAITNGDWGDMTFLLKIVVFAVITVAIPLVVVVLALQLFLHLYLEGSFPFLY